jgi:hypothetical protein
MIQARRRVIGHFGAKSIFPINAALPDKWFFAQISGKCCGPTEAVANIFKRGTADLLFAFDPPTGSQ